MEDLVKKLRYLKYYTSHIYHYDNPIFNDYDPWGSNNFGLTLIKEEIFFNTNFIDKFFNQIILIMEKVFPLICGYTIFGYVYEKFKEKIIKIENRNKKIDDIINE